MLGGNDNLAIGSISMSMGPGNDNLAIGFIDGLHRVNDNRATVSRIRIIPFISNYTDDELPELVDPQMNPSTYNTFGSSRVTGTSSIGPSVSFGDPDPPTIITGPSSIGQSGSFGDPDPPAMINVPHKHLKLNIIPDIAVKHIISDNNGIPASNPYVSLPVEIIDKIATDRDIAITGEIEEKANLLYMYDQIMPEWIQSVMDCTIETIQMLPECKIFVYGALNGVVYKSTYNFNPVSLVAYTRLYIIVTETNHPSNGILPILLESCDIYIMKYLMRIFNMSEDYVNFMAIDDIKTCLISRETKHVNINKIQEFIARDKLLTTHQYSHIINDLYNYQDHIVVAQTTPHPLEKIILNLASMSSNEVMEIIGMVMPNNTNRDVDTYIQENITAYRHVLTRENFQLLPLNSLKLLRVDDLDRYIKRLTDREIFFVFGVKVYYYNRRNLVDTIYKATLEEIFFVPLNKSYDRSRNKETMLGSDILDPEIMTVAFGTVYRYYTYELKELLFAFYRDDLTGLLLFRHPEDIKIIFKIPEMENLSALLLDYDKMDLALDLIHNIETGISDMHEKTQYDDDIIKEFHHIQKKFQIIIGNFLRQLFTIGMYMRRWQGPPHPYPISKISTDITKYPDPTVIVSAEIVKGLEILNQLGDSDEYPYRKFCMKLKAVQYTLSGHLEIGTETFGIKWESVIREEFCIRQASTIFIGTGYHYLRILLQEKIPNFEPIDLDVIQ